MQDPQILLWVLNIVLAIAAGLMKMQVNDIKRSAEKLSTDVADNLKTLNQVKVDYVQKTDFGTFESRLWERFDRIEDKLDQR